MKQIIKELCIINAVCAGIAFIAWLVIALPLGYDYKTSCLFFSIIGGVLFVIDIATLLGSSDFRSFIKRKIQRSTVQDSYEFKNYPSIFK